MNSALPMRMAGRSGPKTAAGRTTWITTRDEDADYIPIGDDEYRYDEYGYDEYGYDEYADEAYTEFDEDEN